MCHNKFSPFDLKLMFFVLGSVVIVYLAQLSNKDFGQKELAIAAWTIYIIHLICQMQFIYTTVHQMSTSLGIRVFHVRDKVSFHSI